MSLIVCTTLWFALLHMQGEHGIGAQRAPTSQELSLPEPQIHPLPEILAQWQDLNHQGDYFSEIKPTPLGYLIWSEFPIKVFIEPATGNNSAESDRSRGWVTAVTTAIQEWSTYFPLQQVEVAEEANITIWRSAPPIQGFTASDPSRANTSGTTDQTHLDQTNTSQINAQQPSLPRLPRIRSAETRYQIFVDRSDPALPRLSHRFTVYLSPNQTPEYTQATARHELGHALGIWGHSPLETDALYFSQVRSPVSISNRDINTLKQIYEQPTQLGWQLVISNEQQTTTPEG